MGTTLKASIHAGFRGFAGTTKQQGKQVFELGGYPIDTECPRLIGVNALTDQFNGVLVPSYRIRSYWLVGLKQLMKLLQRLS